MSPAPPLRGLLAVALAASACAGGGADELADRGLAAAREGRLDEALGRFEAALRLDPTQPKALYNAGLANLALDRAPAAVDHFARFVAARPDDMLGQYHFARAKALAGDADGAILALRRAVELGFADYEELVSYGDFKALFRDARYLGLELTVAQRAGYPAAGGGALADLPRGPTEYGGQAVPGLRLPGVTTPHDDRCPPGRSRDVEAHR